MDLFTIMNVSWGVAFIIAAYVNVRIGFVLGVKQSYDTITLPIIKYLIENNLIDTKTIVINNDNSSVANEHEVAVQLLKIINELQTDKNKITQI